MTNKVKKLQTDYLGSDALNRMSLTLDYDLSFETEAIVPRLWHWLYFLPQVKASQAGNDGHPIVGDFIPAIEGLDRRMWAGSRFVFHDELYTSRNARKESEIVSITEKQGRSGRLAFVLARYEYYQDDRHVITEEHDIVFKQAPKSNTTVADVNATLTPPTRNAQWSEIVNPDAVLLFKYSALTFNGHRIHYDREFCKNEFGFPGLVVHGPLLATLLMEVVRKNLPDYKVLNYSFRAKGPIFDFQQFRVEGCREKDEVFLWVVNDSGFETMSAKATIRQKM